MNRVKPTEITADIYTAFAEATIDTFDALYKGLAGTDAQVHIEVLRDLNPSYVHLAEVTQIDPQVLLNNISLGAKLIVDDSDHRMLVSGTTPRELRCDTCQKLLSSHAKGAGVFDVLLVAFQDIEAIAALHEASAQAEQLSAGADHG